jgi:hypothetical protein
MIIIRPGRLGREGRDHHFDQVITPLDGEDDNDRALL